MTHLSKWWSGGTTDPTRVARLGKPRPFGDTPEQEYPYDFSPGDPNREVRSGRETWPIINQAGVDVAI